MPPLHSQFETTQIQATVFAPGGQLAVSRLFTRIIEQFPDLASGEPIILPSIPAPNVPRILLHSADSQFEVQIMAEAATYRWSRQPGIAPIALDHFLRDAHRFLSFFLEEAPAKAGRLALVTHRACLQDDPANMMSHYFCGDERARAFLGPLDSFELHALQRFDLAEDFPVNSWIRCRPGVMLVQDGLPSPPHPSVYVEQDINTLAELADTVFFSSEQIQRFWNLAAQRQNAILQRYFPEEAP